ncbi:hypothetical protein D3C81_1395600 [compost metagenome]
MSKAASLKKLILRSGWLIASSQRYMGPAKARQLSASVRARASRAAPNACVTLSRSRISSSASAWYIVLRSNWPPSGRICSGISLASICIPVASHSAASDPEKKSPAKINAFAFANRWLPNRWISSRFDSQRTWAARLSSSTGDSGMPFSAHLIQLMTRSEVG